MSGKTRRGGDFPYLSERERFPFPEPQDGWDGVVGVGGNLSPGMLLSAYEQGVFPWFGPEDPIIWHSPDPRFVLFPEALHVSASMKRLLKAGRFELALDRDFPAVIRGCAAAPRQGQSGTWITDDMIGAYCALHSLGWAHSAEAYRDGRLVGGCYGIALGNVFFGESMFARESNASKAAFLSLAATLFSDGVSFIDCQVRTEHLASLGAEDIPRSRFLVHLAAALAVRGDCVPTEGAAPRPVESCDVADRRGPWGERYPDFSRVLA